MTFEIPENSSQTQLLNVAFQQQIVFTRGVFNLENNSLKSLIPNDARVLFFVDKGLIDKVDELTGVIKSYLRSNGYTAISGGIIALPGGETVKNDLIHLKKIIEIIEEKELCRHSYLVAVGGGALLDAVGFAASISHRGIRHIRIPTTVLSQNDSGMGVKNGVNYLGHKNLLGAFNPPDGVIVDFEFLKTLPDRTYREGISEAFKVAILKDRDFLTWLLETARDAAHKDWKKMEQLVYRCAQLHLNHIASGGDPFEKTSARPLDFGHWSAHHLEEKTQHRLSHGEAVSIGICLDLQIASILQLISEREAESITQALNSCGLPVWHDCLLEAENGDLALLSALESFRRHIGGKLTLVMPDGIGSETEINSLPIDTLKEALQRLKLLSKKV